MVEELVNRYPRAIVFAGCALFAMATTFWAGVMVRLVLLLQARFT
jgi:hypothetical protein